MTRVALLLALAGVAAPLEAQRDPELVRAVRLAQEGSGDSARAITARMLASVRDTDQKYAEVLYAAAVVAANPRDRRLHLQRIAVEYTQSEWADDALLELGKLDYAARDPAGTVRQVDRLLSDYPESSLRAPAALWGARAAFDIRDRERACRWSDLGLGVVGGDVELRNQLEFQRERCLALAREESSTVQPRPQPARGWAVQVAAVKTRGEADTEVARIRRVDMPAMVVQEGGWFKVRSGPFPSRERAAEALTQLRKSLGGKPFLVAPKD